jgi:hypothetical protein
MATSLDLNEHLMVFRIKPDSGEWSYTPGSARRFFFLSLTDYSDPDRYKALSMNFVHANIPPLSISVMKSYYEYDPSPFQFFVQRYEAYNTPSAGFDYDWQSFARYSSFASQIDRVYRNGSMIASHNVVPEADPLNFNLDTSTLAMGSPQQEGFNGYLGDVIFTLAGADISDPDRKIAHINTKLDTETLHTDHLDNHFGPGTYVWYKLDEEEHDSVYLFPTVRMTGTSTVKAMQDQTFRMTAMKELEKTAELSQAITIQTEA